MLKIETLEPKMAESDIECWVVLENGAFNLLWLRRDNKISTLGKDYSYLGLYSYKYRSEAEKFEAILKRGGIEIRKAVIPKGSKYYEGIQGWSFPVSKENMTITKYCSEKIKIKE